MMARAERLTALPPVATAIIFAAFVAWAGIPTLRHDWSVWAPGGYFSQAWSTFGGWVTGGFGSPRPFPTDYLLVAFNAAIVAIVGQLFGFIIDVFLIGFATAAGAARLCRCFTASNASAAAAALFATFNPWTYNEVVAGHIYMVLTYAGVMLLLSELLAPRCSSFRLGGFLLLTLGQLQFFLPALAGVCVYAAVARSRAALRALLVAVLASLPLWIGFFAERTYLRSTPFTLTWQQSASVDPLSALRLGGYFARYALSLGWLADAAMWTIVAIAVAGALLALVRDPKRTVWPVLGVLAVWAFVAGTRGTLAGAYTWIVVHVPEIGVYRELYDAVAFLVIAYVVACAVASRAYAPLRWVWLASGIALLAAWTIAPPWRFWVSAQNVPAITVRAAPNTRYALMPPLQPIMYRGGSGLDPHAVALPDNVTPLNTEQFSDPESPALMRYALTSDPRGLEALSVSEVIDRPQFKTDRYSLQYQLALPPPRMPAAHPGNVDIAALPELELAPVPPLSDVPQALWHNAIFFGDVPGEPTVRVVAASSAEVAASAGWVDARSAFIALPRLSQELGGVITTDPRALLSLSPGDWTLVAIAGVLASPSGMPLATTTKGYRWLAPLHADAVRCFGRCIVVAQTKENPYGKAREAGAVPSEAVGAEPRDQGGTDGARSHCSAALGFRLVAPWLALAELPPSPHCLLRYNVRFDRYWLAYAKGMRLTHVAIDSAANGWIVPPHPETQHLVIIEWVAALQFAAQVVAIIVLLTIATVRALRVALGLKGHQGERGRAPTGSA